MNWWSWLLSRLGHEELAAADKLIEFQSRRLEKCNEHIMLQLREIDRLLKENHELKKANARTLSYCQMAKNALDQSMALISE